MFSPNELFEITYRIKANGTSSGTCFTLEHMSRRYLVTAKHVLNGASTNIEVETKDGFKKISFINYYEAKESEVDIVAIELDVESSQLLNFNTTFFDYTSNGLPLGIDTFFLGYPYNLSNRNMSTTNRPSPIVKKGVSSGLVYDASGDPIGFLLDGHNNPGFSGGPCFFFNNIGDKRKWQLFSVISSYVTQTEILYDEKGNRRMVLNENSGIINSHSIDKIISVLS